MSSLKNAQNVKKRITGFEKNGWINTERPGRNIGSESSNYNKYRKWYRKIKWSLFLATMFIFSLDHNILEYLKNMDIPYAQLKEWLNEKRKEEK